MDRYRLYSDRQKDSERAGQEDVYQYTHVPAKTRVQIRQIVEKAFGKPRRHFNGRTIENPRAAWAHENLTHEKGVDHFGYNAGYAYTDLINHLEKTPETVDFLDALELVCISLLRSSGGSYWEPDIQPEDAIDHINFRLRDAGVGFQFESGQLIRVDSQFAHAELIKPALTLLGQEGFKGPQSEFLNAHEHYRAGRFKEAITDAAKAFESLMKAICDRKGWTYASGARATDLLKVLRAHALWPAYLDGSFDQLIATLASGLPKVRNDDAAHGQGAMPKEVADYIAAYALHLSAAKMILIARAANESD